MKPEKGTLFLQNIHYAATPSAKMYTDYLVEADMFIDAIFSEVTAYIDNTTEGFRKPRRSKNNPEPERPMSEDYQVYYSRKEPFRDQLRRNDDMAVIFYDNRSAEIDESSLNKIGEVEVISARGKRYTLDKYVAKLVPGETFSKGLRMLIDKEVEKDSITYYEFVKTDVYKPKTREIMVGDEFYAEVWEINGTYGIVNIYDHQPSENEYSNIDKLGGDREVKKSTFNFSEEDIVLVQTVGESWMFGRITSLRGHNFTLALYSPAVLNYETPYGRYRGYRKYTYTFDESSKYSKGYAEVIFEDGNYYSDDITIEDMELWDGTPINVTEDSTD